MAEKPFPFSVCKECCGTGGGDVDLSNYYTKEETDNVFARTEKVENKVDYLILEQGAGQHPSSHYPTARVVANEFKNMSSLYGKVKYDIEDIYNIELPKKANKNDVYTKEETDSKIGNATPKWKTLIDMTLTAEQAGSTGIKIEIPDYLSFANARKIRFAMSMPVGEALAANKAWARVRFKDFDGVAYDQAILAGYNKALTANSILYMTAAVDVFDFKYNETYKRSFHSVFQLPNSHYTAPENSTTTASECTGAFPRDYMLSDAYHPYLSIVTGANQIPLSEGTHIFLEVCEV